MEKLCQTELGAKRRALLENSLVALLEERRYQDITVKEICQRAQIPRRTFYHYFDCKEAVLHAVVENMLNECSLEVLLTFNAGYTAAQESLVRNFRYWSGPGRKKLDILMNNGLSGELMRCALRWIEAERMDVLWPQGAKEKEIEISKLIGVSGFVTLLMYWRRNEYREPPEEMAELAMRILSEPLFHV